MKTKNSSMAYIKNGAHRYPVVSVEQCHTCQSPKRRMIERLLIDGLSPARIAAKLPEEHKVSAQSIRRHLRRNHLPVDHKLVVRRQEVRAEQRWEEVGIDATVFRATEAEVSEFVHRVVVERLKRGELELTAETLLKTCKFDWEVERVGLADEREAAVLRQRLAEDFHNFRLVLELLGDLEGEHVRDRLVQAAVNDERVWVTMMHEEFDELRQAYLDAGLADWPPPVQVA